MREQMLYDTDRYQLRDYIIERLNEVTMANRDAVPGGVVFFGDSLTQFMDLKRFYPEYKNAYNCGIAGITSDMLLHFIDEGVLKYRPSTVFLMVGTNDLGNTTMTSPRQIALNVKEIIEIIHNNLPDCRINLLSCIPCDEAIQSYMAKGTTLRRNDTLRMVFEEYQRVIPYSYVHMIDMFDALYDENGHLDTSAFKDGLHVNDAGYEKLVAAVKRQL